MRRPSQVARRLKIYMERCGGRLYAPKSNERKKDRAAANGEKMLNQLVILGRLVKITSSSFILNTQDYGEIEFYACENILENMTSYVKPNDMVGIKGHIEGNNGSVKVYAEKVSFLSSNSNLNKEEV